MHTVIKAGTRALMISVAALEWGCESPFGGQHRKGIHLPRRTIPWRGSKTPPRHHYPREPSDEGSPTP